MDRYNVIKLKAHGFALSNAAALYLSVIYMAAMLGILPLLILIGHLFSSLTIFTWVASIPVIMAAAILLGSFLGTLFRVVMEPDSVSVRWLGITVRRIPASRLRLFCAVGNGREDVLCLACCSLEEMAQRQEKRLLRNVLTKCEVPFRKRRTDWQNDFAREYLNGLRSNVFRLFRTRDVVLLQMDPALQYLVRQMYSHIPYRNFTGVTSCYSANFFDTKEDRAMCVRADLWNYSVALETDGIRISDKKGEVSFVPAWQIKTLVRVDAFKGYDKFAPHHLPLLVISCLSEEELAGRADEESLGELDRLLPNRQALLAMVEAAHQALRWEAKNRDFCVIHYSKDNVRRVRALYPDAEVNDIAANWLQDADAAI